MVRENREQPSIQEQLASLKQREQELSDLVKESTGKDWQPRYEELMGLREEIKELQNSIPSAGPVPTVSEASLRASRGGLLDKKE